jgi:hypothetical protein
VFSFESFEGFEAEIPNKAGHVPVKHDAVETVRPRDFLDCLVAAVRTAQDNGRRDRPVGERGFPFPLLFIDDPVNDSPQRRKSLLAGNLAQLRALWVQIVEREIDVQVEGAPVFNFDVERCVVSVHFRKHAASTPSPAPNRNSNVQLQNIAQQNADAAYVAYQHALSAAQALKADPTAANQTEQQRAALAALTAAAAASNRANDVVHATW